MKIELIAVANSIHTVRRANGLSVAGHKAQVIYQQPFVNPLADELEVRLFPNRAVVGYYPMAPAVRRPLDKIRLNNVNAHYASGHGTTGHGTTGRLVNYRPRVLFVWGIDVYVFPFRLFIHKWVGKKSTCGGLCGFHQSLAGFCFYADL
jgi:hypothetical protein